MNKSRFIAVAGLALLPALGLALATPAGAQDVRTPQECKRFAESISAMALDRDEGEPEEDELPTRRKLGVTETEESTDEINLEARRIWRGDLSTLTSAQIEARIYWECLAHPEK